MRRKILGILGHLRCLSEYSIFISFLCFAVGDKHLQFVALQVFIRVLEPLLNFLKTQGIQVTWNLEKLLLKHSSPFQLSPNCHRTIQTLLVRKSTFRNALSNLPFTWSTWASFQIQPKQVVLPENKLVCLRSHVQAIKPNTYPSVKLFHLFNFIQHLVGMEQTCSLS